MAETKSASGITVISSSHGEGPSDPHRTASDASQISIAAALQSEPVSTLPSTIGRPQEHFQLDDAAPEDETQYPKGAQLWLNMIAILLTSFLRGLDTTIIAVAVPKLTDQFKTIADIGWYSAIYGLIMSSTCFFFGKLYTLFDLKWTCIASVAIFELGSIFCTFAPNSKVFILGRALAGMLVTSAPRPPMLIWLRIWRCRTRRCFIPLCVEVLSEPSTTRSKWSRWLCSVLGVV